MNNACIRFSPKKYVELELGEELKITTVIDGVKEEYNGINRKNIWENPDITQQMASETLCAEDDIIEYDYLCFVVTDTSNSLEVEQWVEIAPMKETYGQFILSFNTDNKLYGRKVYRTAGNIKNSTAVYELGATTQNKDVCIIKSVDVVKIK